MCYLMLALGVLILALVMTFRKTFEPYLSTMSDIIIELYGHDTDGLRYYNDVRDLNNALYKIKFC